VQLLMLRPADDGAVRTPGRPIYQSQQNFRRDTLSLRERSKIALKLLSASV